ncbi:hypothetical protein HanPSC8_Chr08g0343811 [Helianthus annuus]|nr:hypothetical protein HanPSC8_Chr08g0343811 [Helianthus annuus]
MGFPGRGNGIKIVRYMELAQRGAGRCGQGSYYLDLTLMTFQYFNLGL